MNTKRGAVHRGRLLATGDPECEERACWTCQTERRREQAAQISCTSTFSSSPHVFAAFERRPKAVLLLLRRRFSFYAFSRKGGFTKSHHIALGNTFRTSGRLEKRKLWISGQGLFCPLRSRTVIFSNPLSTGLSELHCSNGHSTGIGWPYPISFWTGHTSHQPMFLCWSRTLFFVWFMHCFHDSCNSLYPINFKTID